VFTHEQKAEQVHDDEGSHWGSQCAYRVVIVLAEPNRTEDEPLPRRQLIPKG